MVNETLGVLCASAASLGVIHTLIGLDHALPFAVLSKAHNWSLKKTLAITALCGVAHVASSVMIGLLVVWAGMDLLEAINFETARGSVAAWGLVALGIGYGLYRWNEKRKSVHHNHMHTHVDGSVHSHPHTHHKDHAHSHAERLRWPTLGLFLVFLVGPCEVLIPVLVVPAGALGIGPALLVSFTFCISTVLTMVAMVSCLLVGIGHVRTEWFHRNSHWLTGGTIASSGLAIIILGG
jgi:ABC-type nickel/cobalt efflux system permease component RcnA